MDAIRIRSLPFALVCLLLVLAPLAGCRSAQVSGGNLHLEEGRLDEAEAAYRAALAENPHDAEAHFHLGSVLALQGKAIEADRHFVRAAELRASLRRRIEVERERFATRYQSEASSLLREKRAEEARRSLLAATTIHPGHPRTAFLLGQLEAAAGRDDAALAYYREAHAAAPDDREIADTFAASLVARADAAEAERRYAEAWSALAEASRLVADTDLHYRQGTLAYAWAEASAGAERRERLDLSAAAFGKVLDRVPNDQDAAYNLGAVLLAAERYGEAIEAYRKLLRLAPRDGEVYLALSAAYARIGDTSLAAASEAIGRTLRAADPVEDPAAWARRSAERYPGGDLARIYGEFGAPQSVYTVRMGGALVESWFYDKDRQAASFRDGALAGSVFRLP